MFKKLKDKIAEEVKQSPLKSVQQLAQAVVSPSSSSVFEPSSNNDHFCIDDNDDEVQETRKNSPAKLGGFTSVDLQGQISSPSPDRLPSRRSSISSVTSEASSLFPIFESSAAANYHLQSDMESTSEMEDGLGAGWEHLSKERIVAAFQKSKQRYLKYKGRYSNIILHYRELEVERNKLKSVLSETQDKALRRIAELKEQCFLEQKAKAHLEEALRNDLEEKDHSIDALNTKIRLLKARSDNTTENLIDFTDSSSPKSIESADLKDRIKKLEGLLGKCKVAISAKNSRIISLRAQLGNIEDSQKQINGELAINTHEEKDNDSDLEELLIQAESDLQRELNIEATVLQQKGKELAQEKEKVMKTQNELQKYQNSVQELEKELTELKKKFESEVTERCKAEYLLEQNNNKLKEEEQKLVEKSKEVDIFKNKVNVLEEQLEQMNCKLDSDVKAQESLEEFMTEEVREKNKEIEEYQNEVKKLKNDLNQIKETLDSETVMRNALEIAEKENLIKEKEMVKDLNKVIEKLKVENKQIEKDMLELKNKFDNQVLSNSLLEDAYRNIQKEVSENSVQCTENDKLIKQYQIENNKLENEILELKGKIEQEVAAHISAQNSNDVISKKLKEKEDEILLNFKNLEEIQDENTNLKKELLILSEKCNNVSTAHSSTKDVVKVLEDKITEREDKILEQNSQIENYKKHTKTLKYELVESQRKLDSESSVRLKLETTILENENNKFEREEFENSELKKEIIDMKEKFENCLLEKLTVERKLSETEEKMLQLNSEIEKNQFSVEQTNLELIKVRSEIAEKAENVIKLEEQLLDIKTEVENGLALVSEKNAELNNIKDFKTKLESDLFAATEQIDIFKAKYENSQRELLAAFEGSEKSQQVSVENLELKDKLSEIQQQLDTYRTQFQKKYQSDMHNVKANFEKMIEDKSNEILQLRNANEQLEEQLALKNNSVNELSTNLNQAEKDSQLIIKDLQEKLILKESEMVTNLGNFKEKIKHQSEDLKRILSEKLKLESELTSLNNMSEQYSNIKVENENLLLKINNLQSENQNCNIKIKELASQLTEKDLIQNKISVEKNEHKKTVNELLQLKNLHEKIVQKQQNLVEKSLIQKNNVDELKEMLSILAHYFRQMNLELKEELNRTKINCVNACNMVNSIRDKQTNDCINETEKKYSTEIKKLESELNSSKSEYRLLLEEYESLQSFNNELNSQVSDLTLRLDNVSSDQEEINQLREDKRNLNRELSELKDSHTQQLKTLVMDFQVQLEKKDEDYRTLEDSQFDRRQDEECYAANEMKEQILNLQQDLETRGDAFEKLLEEHKELVQNRDAEISELKSKQVKELREHDKKWRACLDKRLAEEEIRHQEEITELSKEWHAERKNVFPELSVPTASVKQTEVLEKENQLATTLVESGGTSLDMVRRQLTLVTHQLNEQQRQHKHEVAELQRLLTINNHRKTFMDSSLEDCTEMEYLRNVLYEYMMGKEPLVLAKVLAAIVKFDSNQMRSVISKEEQKVSLMGQLGFG